MNRTLGWLLAAIAGGLALAAAGGCTQSPGGASGFPPGAFPPTLSDQEYHSKSWTRGDCLTCHETGVMKAPVMRHTSVPPLAKDAKCRTCHISITEKSAGP